MNIYEISEQWSIDNPYIDKNDNMPYSNQFRYIDDKKWDNLVSKMDFLEGVSELTVRHLFAQINLYTYSQRSKNNYSKVPRPDKIINPLIQTVNDLIKKLDNPFFRDDIKNLESLKDKLTNTDKQTFAMYYFAYPQKPMTKEVIRNMLNTIIDKYNLQVKQKDKKDFIDFI